MGKLLACLFVKQGAESSTGQQLDQMIHLFNTENYKEKPFQTFTIDNETKEIRSMKFSPNGKNILLGTRQNVVMLLDAYKGTVINRFEGEFCNPNSETTLTHAMNLEQGFSPDSKYIISASHNTRKNVFIWNVETGKEVNISQFHPTTVQCAKFSH
jgi:WD40 repeat protein